MVCGDHDVWCVGTMMCGVWGHDVWCGGGMMCGVWGP